MADSAHTAQYRKIPIRRGFRRSLSAWLPVAICVTVIAFESQPMFGTDHTTGPLRHLCEMLFGPISEDRWEIFHFLIRKTGHLIGYGVLSLAWLRAFRMSLTPPKYPIRAWLAPHGFAMLGTLLIASCDEIHQTFLPNRTGKFHDVVIDCAGALVMQVAAFLWLKAQSSIADRS